MIDRSHIGRLLPSHTAAVEAGRLRLFAKATGEDRPEYLDHAAALAAGFSGLPAPPTFLFALENEVTDNLGWLRAIWDSRSAGCCTENNLSPTSEQVFGRRCA